MSDGTLRTYTLVIWGLYLIGILGPFVGFPWGLQIVGFVMAYARRSDANGSAYESHMTSAIWTAWLGWAAGAVLLAAYLAFALMGFPGLPGPVLLFPLLGAWVSFRTVRGLLFAAQGKPIASPKGWL